jgi:DNA-binding transcriptional LysR family regulator
MTSLDPIQGLPAFVRTVQAGSFSAAARLLGSKPSAISKSVARLERRLGVRLLQRSTRSLTLTREGASYYDRVEPLLRALDEAGDVIQSPATAQGLLRVTAPAEVGRSLAEPITKVFVPRHPRLRLELSVSDRHAELVREGLDVAIRVGEVADSDLNARRLATVPMALVASPAYLAARGIPQTVSSLREHAHVRYVQGGQPYPIRFCDGEVLTPDGVLDTDAGDVLRIAALNGLGIIQVLRSSVQDDIDRGRLVVVLPERELPNVPIHALHAFGRHTPARARLLIDFLVEHFESLGRRDPA